MSGFNDSWPLAISKKNIKKKKQTEKTPKTTVIIEALKPKRWEILSWKTGAVEGSQREDT